MKAIFLLLFGCRHPERSVSRPFTLDNVTYCVCLECGAKLEA